MALCLSQSTYSSVVFRHFRKIAKTGFWLRRVCPSVRPHGTTRPPLDRFSWNLIFDNFSKIWRENQSLIKIWQKWRVLYMKTDLHFWTYLVQFFLQREMFQTKLAEIIKTRILFSITFFFLNHAFHEIMWKNIVEPPRPHITIWHMRISCWIPKATNIHSEYVIHVVIHCSSGCTDALLLRYKCIACLVRSWTRLCVILYFLLRLFRC